MITLADFRQNAASHGICPLSEQWDKARSKKQLMDLALSAKAMPYIARAIAEGWGVSPDFISTEFEPFLNGRFIYHGDGYSSVMHCQNPDVYIHTTAALIVDCHGVVETNRICQLYIVNSDVKLTGYGRAIVHLFNSTVDNGNLARYTLKEDIRL
jgi:hypothetical protein